MMQQGNLIKKEDLKVGDMVIYPYRWGWKPEDEVSDKRRPCMVILRTKNPAGADVVVLVPVTTKKINDRAAAILIDPPEREKASLMADKVQAISIAECNVEILKETSRINPFVPMRRFSPLFTDKVKSAFVQRLQVGKVGMKLRKDDVEDRPTYGNRPEP